MTTVACDRLGMAADSFLATGDRVCKIYRVRGALVGVAGDMVYALRLVEWLRSSRGTPKPDVPDDSKPDDADLLILRPSGIYLMDGECVEIKITRSFAAIGSGAGAARAAMAAGATPLTAVEIAAELDAATKGPCHYVSLQKP
jgi:ATP-dependent protease HslVU (ClpYQ) peptidase subunit